MQPSGAAPLTGQWFLDCLGNWGGNLSGPSIQHTGDFNGGGLADSKWENHVFNKVHEVTLRASGTIDPFESHACIHDPAGNLAYDGQYVYQYDAWNRLIQVNVAGVLPANWKGQILSASERGPLVCRYTYDGLGRLIVKETPVTAGADTPVQRKDLYYDGVRRIQETIWRGDLAPITGRGGNDELGYQAEGAEGSNQISQPRYYWTDRESVYGPEYVDELRRGSSALPGGEKIKGFWFPGA